MWRGVSEPGIYINFILYVVCQTSVFKNDIVLFTMGYFKQSHVVYYQHGSQPHHVHSLLVG